jgi:anti-sigma regulatory factor (Ser/Thr protein kinase)
VHVAIRAYTFANAVESVPKARRSVHNLLHTCKYDSDLIDKTLVCTSELVTNAVMHAGTSHTFTVLCRLQIDLITIGVLDRSPQPPRRLDVSEDADSGRGIALMEALSDEWGWRTRPPGKMVFVRFKAEIMPQP